MMTGTLDQSMNLEALIRRFAALNGRAPDALSPGLALGLLSERPSCERLPGGMTPRGDHDLNPGMDIARELRPAAVLVPIVARQSGLTVLFTLRTANLAHHAGQISFPGGHMEAGDVRPEDAALRETEEEVGLARRHVRVIGRLDRYVTRTGFDVTPVVGLVNPPFAVAPDPTEVAEVFEVPLGFLLDPANHQRHSRAVEGQLRHFHAMRWHDYYIWGATAGMLMNLYEFLRREADAT